MKCVPPLAQLFFTLTQEGTDQALKRFCQSRVWDVPLVLIELARCKKTARRNQRLMQFVDERGFADSGISGNQHQTRPIAGYHALERTEQHLNLACSPIQLLGNQQTIWNVMFAEREIGDASALIPFSEAAAKIALRTEGRLVTFFRSFGDQFHHDRGKTARYGFYSLVRRHRMACDVTMNQFHRIRSRKGQATGQHFVKRHPERIKVTARINGPIHSSGLFGRHVAKCSRDELGRLERLTLARKPRGDTKTGKPDPASHYVNHDIGGLDVFVDQFLLVQLPERGCETDGNPQKLPHLNRPLNQTIERLAAGVFKNKRLLSVTLKYSNGSNSPCYVQIVAE